MSFFLIAFPALFSIINPLGGSFIFLLATDQYTPAVRAQLARWVAIYSFAIVTCSGSLASPFRCCGWQVAS